MRPNKRDELVCEALKVFYRDGFHATGMDKLVAETGISKTSMYKHFRTKEELILAVLHLRDENFRNWVFAAMEARGKSPRAQLLALFDVLHEWFEQDDFRGCMFIKAASEYQEAAHPIHAQAAEHKKLFLNHITKLAKAGGAARPDELARQLTLLKEGAIVTAHLGHTQSPAKDAKKVAKQLLAQI